MFAFIARQPILDREKDVFAYELLFRDGKGGTYPKEDPAKADLIAKHYHTLGLNDIACDKTSFINFSSDTLLERFPTSLDPETVVIEIDEDPSNNHTLISACRHIKDMGYKLALDDPGLLSGKSSLLPIIDVVKVDIVKSNYDIIEQNLPRFLDADVTLVAEHVDSQRDFSICRELGFNYFQGYFFAKPENLKPVAPLPASKMTLVQLIGESSSSEFSIDKVNDIISRDAALSYMLLKFINNPTINKRYKINSLRHALTYMGEVEIKKFVALLALANLGDDKPMELLHMSLVRAHFCDLVAKEKGIGSNPPTGFLVGLFSLLDALLDQKMEQVLSQIPLVEEVSDALLGKKSELSMYLALVKAFESATWLNVIRLAEALNIDQKRLHSLFNEAIVWGNSVRQSISPHYPAAVP
ncbi:EAL and HDOD domain-containing protein [Aestuariibacter salexigens]|uniref:EAL and HDOD domain-containing protein n=1 Tax=Aestuariibacter salexigens TaxID=226010 RepID=UPI0003FA96E6|nr:EAL domain-containing protein [Aestuariibacter salexigens]